MNQRFRALWSAALIAVLCASSSAATPSPADSDAAKAKLAALRARIAELTGRMGSQLAQRDTLSARVRETELVIAAKRRRVEELHAAQLAAERRRSELRAEESRNLNALQAQRASLASQARAAYMIGRQEELKLLLNQSNPASLGRTLTYYGYFAEQRSQKIKSIQSDAARLQHWSRRSSSKRRNCRSFRMTRRKRLRVCSMRARNAPWRWWRSIKNWRAAIRNLAT
jgi:septal ring factor EnvC (AmiA/AmiB activator)